VKPSRRCTVAAVAAVLGLVWMLAGRAFEYRRSRAAAAARDAAVALAGEKIQRGAELLAAFQSTSDPSQLERAVDVLRTVGVEERRLRKGVLELFLRAFALVEASLDPSWDPRCAPAISVRFSDSKDPAEIRAFQQQLAERDAQGERFTLQQRLRRIERSCGIALDEYIAWAYSATAEDQAELTDAITPLLSGYPRARRFLALIPR
jgi:hypothetical protein